MRTSVTFSQNRDIGTLCFRCIPEGKPPTLDSKVLDELETALIMIRENMDQLRAVLIRSDFEKYFIVGANIKALEKLNSDTIGPWVRRGHAVFNQLEDLTVPTIARIDGYALGGGLELALACDLIIASPGAKFGGPEAKLGLVPGWGGTHRLAQRIGLARAKELLFTGRIIDSQTAYKIGLVNFVGDRDELDAYVQRLLEELRSCSPLAVQEIKHLVNISKNQDRSQSIENEAAASQRCMENPDTQDRIRQFLSKRKKS